MSHPLLKVIELFPDQPEPEAAPAPTPARKRPWFHDHTGKVFGRLTVLGRSQERYGTQNEIMWDCQCSCGTRRPIRAAALTRGHNISCGCFKKESRQNIKHGKAHDPEFDAWVSMRQRCSNPKSRAFKDYGGRGITVCDRWQTFENFYADMGPRPSPKHSLDRYPNNDGNYEPGNCRWATKKEQANNRRNSPRRT